MEKELKKEKMPMSCIIMALLVVVHCYGFVRRGNQLLLSTAFVVSPTTTGCSLERNSSARLFFQFSTLKMLSPPPAPQSKKRHGERILQIPLWKWGGIESQV